jgi:glycosyltransferase involved in cell wall biosynthesis
VRVWCDLHEKYAATIITVSQAVKKELPVKSKVVVIGNELPIAPVPYVPANSNVILYCANYIQGKGQEHAIQSFASISARYPEWKLRFVGGDMGLQKNKNFKSDLIRQAERLGINAQIEWNEFQSDISKAYQDSCFVLNFSESESFSLTCLEAQYHGRPVIATRCGGPEEIIEHKVSGILVDLKDIKAMAQAMEYLIINAEERERMAQMAYKSVRTHFGFDNTVGKLLRLYHDVLGSKTEFKMH